MKNLKTITALAILVLVIACETKKINPSSNITTQDRTVAEYSGIDISTVFEVDVTFSTTEEKVEIEANENLHAYIDVRKEGDDLIIKVKDNTSIQGNSTLRAHITTMSALENISVSDASLLVMNNTLVTESIILSVSDASNMDGKLDANTTTIYLDGASQLSLNGMTTTMNANVDDASKLGGYEMVVEDIICVLSGASETNLTVMETIDLKASDASIFRYKGDAVIVDIDLSDAAQIIKID